MVVGEIGYLPVTQSGAILFFQLVNRRYGRASTVLTSNKGFEEWGRILGDEVMAAALQESPAAAALRTKSLTVLLARPSDAAILRWLRPSSYFKRISSRIFRMDNLFCNTLFLLVSGDLGEDGRRRRYSRFSNTATRSLQGDRHESESVIGLSESVIGMRRNPCVRRQSR